MDKVQSCRANWVQRLKADPWGCANKPPNKFSKRETAAAIVAAALVVISPVAAMATVGAAVGALASVTLGER